jgi:hypothetical protein
MGLLSRPTTPFSPAIAVSTAPHIDLPNQKTTFSTLQPHTSDSLPDFNRTLKPFPCYWRHKRCMLSAIIPGETLLLLHLPASHNRARTTSIFRQPVIITVRPYGSICIRLLNAAKHGQVVLQLGIVKSLWRRSTPFRLFVQSRGKLVDSRSILLSCEERRPGNGSRGVHTQTPAAIPVVCATLYCSSDIWGKENVRSVV